MAYVARLIWDAWNVTHIARHSVIPDEVEQLCHSDHIERAAYAGRIMLIGRIPSGRMLSVVLNPQGHDVYYPVTARDASRSERRLYRSMKGDEGE